MATTTNLLLTQLEIGQKNKEVTINTNNSLLDSKVPRALADAASAPATTGLAPGSTYFNTTTLKIYWLRPNLTWAETNSPRALADATSAPATTNVEPGSTYFNTTDSKVYWLRPNLTWVALT